MGRLTRIIPMLSLVLLILACQLSPGLPPTVEDKPLTKTASASPTAPIENPTPTQMQLGSTPSETSSENPAASGPCQIVAASDTVTAYNRPSLQADPFGQIAGAGFPLLVLAQTTDGWLGFDPGVAQAANTGVFRNRWVQSDQVQVEGACDAVPVVIGPPPGICFTMPMDLTPVYTDPNITSVLIVSLAVEQYAAVLEKTNTGWAKLDLGVGNSGINQTGWVTEDTLNFNGPCDTLPIVTP